MSHIGNKFNHESNAMLKLSRIDVKIRYRFRPSLLGVVIALICIPLFIKLGLWQYSKAQLKLDVQAAYNHAEVDEAIAFPMSLAGTNDIERWKFKKVKLTGVYETQYQFLLDNQVEGRQVGFHVITPFKVERTSQYVLVNRGWIKGNDTHSKLPSFITPEGLQTIVGQIWVPSKKIFTLENKVQTENATEPWSVVWQNMDIEKFKRRVPFIVSDMAIKLDHRSNAGGFVRNWQVPADRITTHIGYAYQWFGFAIAALLIFIYMSFTKMRPEDDSTFNAK